MSDAHRVRIRLMFFPLVLGFACLPSCHSSVTSTSKSADALDPDPSIVADGEQLRVDPKVENGTAYDIAAVELDKANKVVLPDNASVRRERVAGKLQLLMAKTLDFVGHPPEPMSVRGARKNMGCAVLRDGDALVVATYGEWDSRIEGGTKLKLVAVVPDGVEVEYRKGLSGPQSGGQEWHSPYLTKPVDAKDGYWYGPASPAGGWSKVPTVPDPTRAAVTGSSTVNAPIRRDEYDGV